MGALPARLSAPAAVRPRGGTAGPARAIVETGAGVLRLALDRIVRSETAGDSSRKFHCLVKQARLGKAIVWLLSVRDPKAEITNEPAIVSDAFGAGRPIRSRSARSSLLVPCDGQIGFLTSITRTAADTRGSVLPMRRVALYQRP
jgi:hypothetical protein